MNYSAKQIFKLLCILMILINFSLVYAYVDKDNFFSINSSYIVNTAPSKAILFNSKKNNKMYPELGFTFNRSLFSKESNILFKSDFFYRGYITDISKNNDETAANYDFDFNRDITIENFFFEFNKLDRDSIFSFDIGRKDIESFSPLYKNDGISFRLNSYDSGMKFDFVLGKNQNYENNFNKLTFDSLNILIGFSNIQERFMDSTNPKSFFLDYELNYTKTKVQKSSKNYISSAVSAYNLNYFQARTSFEYNIPLYSSDDDEISTSDYEGLTFFNFGISALAKEFPLVSANYSFVNYLTDDYGDTTYISDNNFHNIRLGYKKIFTTKSRLSTRFFIDLQTGDYESRAITAIVKKDKFLFGNDFSVKAKFGSSENYNLINIGVKTDQTLSNYSNILLSYGVDIYAYITEVGGNLSFAPNLFVYGKNLFQVENLSYKLYLRETVYPKSFFRKTLLKFELNYEVQ